MGETMNITIAPGSTVKDATGKTIGVAWDQLTVDKLLGQALVAGGSAVEGWVDKPSPEEPKKAAPAKGKK
jgi:hypothetical protein